MNDQKDPGREHETPLLIFMFGGLFIMGAIQWMGPNLTPWLVSLGLIVTGILLILVSLSGESYDEFLATTPRSYFERSANSIEVGIDKDSGVPIRLPDKVRTQHVQIIGGSGAGKTSSFILPAIAQDVEHGHPIIIIDGKADGSFRKDLESIAAKYKRSDSLQVFDLRGDNSQSYNPLAGLSAHDAANVLVNSFAWSEKHYKARALEALKYICRLPDVQKNSTVGAIAKVIESSTGFSAAINSFLTAKESGKVLKGWYEACSGMKSQLNSLNSGNHAPLLNCLTPEISLQRVISERKIVYFRLPALVDSDASLALGRLILNDLKNLASRQHAKDECVFCPVYIDEFAPFAIQDFATIFAMGRSAGLALHVSHQSMGDLKTVGDPFISQVIDNTATKIFFRLGDDITAEKAARLTGTKEASKITRRATLDGDKAELEAAGSIRDAHEFIYHPQIFKNLLKGELILTSAHGLPTKNGGVLTRRLKVPLFVAPPMEQETKKEGT